MTITVAMPYFGCPDLVGRAVRSVLAQTYRDIHLVVIGDGEEPPLAGLADSRLDVFTLPANMGPYFALQVALLAVGHRWFSPFGADDYADPEHFERLADARKAADTEVVITGAVFNNAGDVHRGPYEVGLFRRKRLLAIGGYNPAERIGQDTLMLRLLRITGSTTVTSVPTYHRVKRPGSLTTSPKTRLGSPARNRMRARNRAVFAQCKVLKRPDAIRVYRESLVPMGVGLFLGEQVEWLSARLRDRVAA